MNAMNVYLLLLRTAHVFGGVLWAGSAVLYLFFITPAVRAVGANGQVFMQRLVGKQRFPMYMNSVSLLTILSGALLYYQASGGLRPAWVTTGPGLGFTIGSVVGIAVFFYGFFMIRPRAERMAAIGAEIERAGGPPSPDQMEEMHRLEQQLGQAEIVDFVLLTISLLTMATARYWWF